MAFLFTLWQFVRAIGSALEDPEFQALLTFITVTLLSGTVFYHNAEGWSLVDSLYFSVITLTTVGYGDLSPTTTLSKLFTIFYLFIGIGTLLAFLNVVAKRVFENRTTYRKRKDAEKEGD